MCFFPPFFSIRLSKIVKHLFVEGENDTIVTNPPHQLSLGKSGLLCWPVAYLHYLHFIFTLTHLVHKHSLKRWECINTIVGPINKNRGNVSIKSKNNCILKRSCKSDHSNGCAV